MDIEAEREMTGLRLARELEGLREGKAEASVLRVSASAFRVLLAHVRLPQWVSSVVN